MIEQLKSLHQAWCQYSQQDINYRATERLWYGLAQLDFTPDDIRCVVQGMQRFNTRSNDAKYRIQAHKVCGDPELFASMVGEFRAKEKNRVRTATPREQVLDQFRSTTTSTTQEQPVKSVREVLREIAK